MELEKHTYFALFKPYGVISQFTSKQTTRKNKKKLGDLYPFPSGTMAIGRLDEASEGLLLLTTNGKFSEYVRSNHFEKEYYVQVDGRITDHAIRQLKKGIEISIEGKEYMTKPALVKELQNILKLPQRAKKIRDDRHGPTSWVSISIREGKFRQVRKMTAAVGFPTLRLIRVRIGNITIENMKAGEVIEIVNLPQQI